MRVGRLGCGWIVALIAALFVLLALMYVFLQGLFALGVFGPPTSDQGPQGPGSEGHSIPPISERLFDGGGSQASASGFFALALDLPIDGVRSYVDEDLAWISFGELQRGDAGEILIALGEPENSITLAQGDFVAIGTDEDCRLDIEVTETRVSGHVSCVGVEGQNVADGSTGPVDFELDFTADS